ncbi:MAG: alpha-2-macroglobulin [Elusimicrobiota bacterium]
MRVALAFLISGLCSFASAADRAKVELFAPQGFVKQVRQATARFSAPMVPLGDLRGREPFDVECGAKGTGRWVDGKNWAYDFDADLPAGLRCRFTLKKGLKALDQSNVFGQRVFEFTTGGPAIIEFRPGEGEYSRISEDQQFILGVDELPTKESVLAHARFSVDGILDPIPATIVEGSHAEHLKTAARWDPARPTVLLAAQRPFPADTVVRLIWGAGVATSSGVATQADQTLTFKTRPAFKAELTCERADAEAGCLPFLPVSVTFSSPVDWKLAKSAVVRLASGKTWSPTKPKRGAASEEEESGEGSDSEGRWITNLSFAGPFPAETALTLSLPSGLVDDAGRALFNETKFPLTFRTGEYPPLAKFPASFGILELKGSPVLPVTLRNLEAEVRGRLIKVGGPATASALDGLRAMLSKTPADPREILRRLDAVLSHERETPVLTDGKTIDVPKPHGAQAFEVVGIPLKDPGFYVVELQSQKLGEALFGKKAPMYVPTAALVTNMSVHLKWGREASLVWVTALDTGRPVPDAEVTVADCQGRTLWSGKSGVDGTARPIIPEESALEVCQYRPNLSASARLIVLARRGDDMSFVLDTWSEGIEPWRFQLPFEYGGRPVTLRRSVLDRSLLRAGETVHMKHFLRRETLEGFALPSGKWPDKAVIEHVGTEQRWELPLAWTPDGTATSEWAVPKEAKLGEYNVIIDAPGEEGRGWYGESELAASFRVEEFRLPVLSAQLQAPAAPLVAVASVPVHVAVRYLSGGAAAGLAVRLRAQTEAKAGLSFPGFEDYSFSNGPVPPAANRRTRQAPPPIRTQDLTLDAAGGAAVVLEGEPFAKTPRDLMTELEFRDPSGETQTVSSRVALWPARRLIGIKSDSWALSAKKLKFRAAVVDLDGKPAAGVPVKVELVERRYRSFRKRLVGGFYAYEHSEKLVRHGALCSGPTDEHGLLTCEVPTTVSGGVVLEASAVDQDGREIVAHADAWVAGDDEWWFSVSDNDRMDLLAERPRYEPGETAQFQVRMPFRSATALVTVEREGVIDSFVRPLSGKSPVVRVPVKGGYSPNVFVSVLAVRGRVGTPLPTALVDLGRPAFKLGEAEIKVGWKAHEMKVAAVPEKAVYKIREKARVAISAAPADGSALAPGSEAAVAVVDEALLELMPNKTWDLLDAMMGRRSLAVRTFTAQMQVVGRRHFGLKALPQGGGGGRQTTRELFDTLVYWNPHVPLDSSGKAVVEFPLNDSVSGFRAVAVVHSGPNRFGTGFGRFAATQDLAILSGVAPLAREGDRYAAVFTVRNATDRPMDVVASATVAHNTILSFAPQSFRLEPNRAREISWPVVVPVGVTSMTFEAGVSESGGERDRVRVSQKIEPSVPVRVLQATLAAVAGTLKFDAMRPEGAIPGRGGMRVSFSPSLAGDMQGILDYMRRYPYGCLEQRTSKAVALRDADMWRATMESLPSYLDDDGLAKYFPLMEHGSDALTAYVVSLADEARWEIPADSRDRMAKALQGFIEGRVERGSKLQTADLAYRKLAAAEALSRLGPLPAGLLKSIPPQPQLWPTSAVLDWRAIQKRSTDAGAPKLVAEADQILRSRLNLQGTTMGFSTDKTEWLWWLMVSEDVNAVKLVLTTLDDAPWKPDMARMLRGALSRQNHGHWDLTTANAWGRLMLEKFARAYENGPVSGETKASLGGDKAIIAWASSPHGSSALLAWPEKKKELIIKHDGRGSPWATIQSLAALPLKEPLSSGYKIERTVTPVNQKTPGVWTRGDIARIHLKISAQADMTWVVVDDPVPGGASVLGSGLGRDSAMATQGEKSEGWVWPTFQERSFGAFRSYYEYVPKGSFTVEYTVRFNNAGSFGMPPTRVEAMYSPEMFGEIPLAPVEVKP